MRKFAKERIFQPLNMKDTTIVDSYPTNLSIARGSTKNEQGTYEIFENPWEHTGDGAVHSNVDDMITWGENFTSGRDRGKELVKRIEKVGPKTTPSSDKIIDIETMLLAYFIPRSFDFHYLEHGEV
ncbi:serine hydrolase [Brevibacillus laterosporus]|uniref:serine hydrolase n=1 Tax=Brevibacillus laterosporus TaxID=1465 RepID=UPI002653A4F8|nr:serine hydrolase [Brevibacillus laterosporus]MDN9011574.1 serine hydrolase [Brevibacillus laterosporus]MDO0942603.1 serine hydrolase [Brevibacillus laterosporus]